MRHRAIGTTGVHFPAIGLGTWAVFDTGRSMRWLADEALAAGVNLFDSSPMYGRAEECVAEALGPRRAEALIGTKISAADADTGARQIARALSLFGTIDLFQIHNIVSWRTHLPRLVALKEAGAVRLIGASQGLLVSDAEFEEVMRTGLLDTIQIRYNPKRPQARERLLPLAQDLGLAVLVMQPLRWGVLLASPEAEELAALEVKDWGAAVLRWILSDTRVTTVLTATETPGRIGANARVAAMPPYSPEQRALVTAVLARDPGLTATAPEMNGQPLLESLCRFLSARLGAGFCDSCVARQFGSSLAEASAARRLLPEERFADELGACLTCGEESRIVRSRTIMR